MRGAAARLGLALDARADERTRAWWERYLKGAVPFRGVPMAGIREVVHEWWCVEQFERLPRDQQLRRALSLFRGRYAEDKLAGVLALAEILLPALRLGDVPRLAEPFARGWIDDWSTCDWYCVKALGPFVALDERRERAEAIAAWRTAEPLWQRRAAAVSFVGPAREGERFYAGFTQLLLDVCRANVRDRERFSQTSVGWLLRELSRAQPDAVRDFVDEHRELMSREALKSATAKLAS